jgi:hypothetical protein
VRPRKSLLSIAVFLLGLLALAPAAAHAEFGIKTLTAGAVNRDGSVDLRAGSYPYEWTLGLGLNQNAQGTPEGKIRDLLVSLPTGMVGNPQAVPRCSGADFDGDFPRCPLNTVIGVAHVQIAGLATPVNVPVFNLTPRPGVPATVGFSLFNENSFQEASLRSSDYGVDVSDISVPTEKLLVSVTETIWGVPAEAGHDAERGQAALEGTGPPVASGLVPKPFLALPTSCTGPLKTTVSIDSVEEPGVFKTQTVESLGEAGSPEGLNGCDRPPFNPRISSQSEVTAADSPTGLAFDLQVPQTELPSIGDPEGRSTATADLKDAVVTLPPGLVFNPSAADGLSACSLAQIELGGPNAPQCPPSSKVGTIEAKTPLLDHPISGAVYVARQVENPFGSLIALYLVLDDPISGVIVKIPGKVEPNPVTGQLRTVVPQNPQLPVEEFSLHFSGGPRGVLTTPLTCGTYTTHAELVPWTSPEGATVFSEDSFKINSGANGSSCPASEAAAPNRPSFEAGTVTPLAGSYSPFVLKLSRENGSQRIGSLEALLPEGLGGKLAGIPYCSDSSIAAAAARSHLGDGALEQAHPSCPLASEVGTVTVGAGSGSPLYVTGHAYLAGPYKGAPLSVEIITPAVAGPFDLGVVAVRAALYVNQSSAQIDAVSDPLPSTLFGVPLDIRSVAVNMSRPQFTLNPTSCDPMAVLGSTTSTLGQVASLRNTFQVGGCNGLEFKPKLQISLKGGTKRTGHPALKAVVTYPKGTGYANIARAQVGLPKSEFLDQGNIGTICSQADLKAATCPKASIYGKATAYSPLLEKPLTGPVYLAGGFGYKLPALVADLNGQIRILLKGKVDTDKQGGIRNTFEAVPDAPVSKFVLEMKGGKKGLLENSTNICVGSHQAEATFKAQNGKVETFKAPIQTSCGAKGKTRSGGKQHG